MRETMSDIDRALLASPSGYACRVRAYVKDVGGTWRNLSDLFGAEWLLSVEWNEDVDEAVSECRITVVANDADGDRTTRISLAPLNEDSLLNRLTGTYEPLIRVNRECYVEVGVVANVTETPNTWHEVFRGDITEVEASKSPIEIVVRDLGHRLVRKYIEAEAPYGSTLGVALETVIQQILDANLGAGVVSLNTIGSTGFDVGPYMQKRTSLMEALLSLAVDQLGWTLRYGFNYFTNKMEALYLAEPDRAGLTVDWTITRDHVQQLRRLGVNMDNIRNAVEITYSDKADLDAAGNPKRKVYLLTDTDSIAKYGRLFMALAEASTSNIDSAAEATTLAESAISDLSEPLAEIEVELDINPFLEINDRVTLEADGLFYTEDQTAAVSSLTHVVTAAGQHRTTVQMRGTPSAGKRRWLQAEQRPGVAPTSSYSGPQAPATVTVEDTTGGAEVVIEPPPYGPRPGGYEVHVNSTPGYTPDASTLKAEISSTRTVLTGLAPGLAKYVRVIPKGSLGKVTWDLGTAAAEVSVTPRYVEPRLLQQRISYGDLPLNGDFEAYNDATVPPDGWSINTAWGTNAQITTGYSGARAVLFPITGSTTALTSQAFTVREGEVWIFSAVYQQSVAAGTAGVLSFTYLDGSLAALSSVSVNLAAGVAATWTRAVQKVVIPSGARYAQMAVSRLSAYAGTLTVDSLDALRGAAFEPWKTPTFENGWTDANLGVYGAVRYRKNDLGEVELRSVAVASTPAPAAGANLFTLPTGYRPDATRLYRTRTSAGDQVDLTINTLGQVKASALTAASDLSLDGVRFFVD